MSAIVSRAGRKPTEAFKLPFVAQPATGSGLMDRIHLPDYPASVDAGASTPERGAGLWLAADWRASVGIIEKRKPSQKAKIVYERNKPSKCDSFEPSDNTDKNCNQ
jgi:hypothetical protein